MLPRSIAACTVTAGLILVAACSSGGDSKSSSSSTTTSKAVAGSVRVTDLLRLALQTSHENPALGPWHIYYGLLEFSRPDNPRTALGLALLVAVPLLLHFWVARPRFEALWGCLLLALTAADLWIFVTGFYPMARLDDLAPRGPAVSFLASQASQERQSDPFRIFV